MKLHRRARQALRKALVALVIALGAGTAAAQQVGPLRAGAAKVDITPAELVTGYVTEAGLIETPAALAKALGRAR